MANDLFSEISTDDLKVYLKKLQVLLLTKSGKRQLGFNGEQVTFDSDASIKQTIASIQDCISDRTGGKTKRQKVVQIRTDKQGF
jgi:hypothetical protein